MIDGFSSAEIGDQLLPTAVGALVLKHNVLELGAIMRGPFHDPNTSYYVFTINRGAGSKLGPTFSARPGITPDALIRSRSGRTVRRPREP